MDLNPAGSTYSIAYAIGSEQQAGFADVGGKTRASVWSGTASSWEDLSLVLSDSWLLSVAQGIWSDDTTLYVCGYGFNNATGHNEALLWTRPIPEPNAAAFLFASGVCLAMRRRRDS